MCVATVRTHQLDAIALTGHQEIGIDVAGIYQVLVRQQLSFGENPGG
jgi:hypothetical protein